MKKYYVMLTNSMNDEEFCLLKTDDIEEAKMCARDEAYYIDRDKRKREKVEIRDYVEDIEQEDCDCFDYNFIAF